MKTSAATLLLFMLLPVVLGANPFRKLREDMLDIMPLETSSRAAHEITKGSMEDMTAQKKLSIMCPGGMSGCPTNNTCCKTAEDPSEYGCCPRPDAVCCEDMAHCCPEGYACDDKSGTCLKNSPAFTSAPLRSRVVSISAKLVADNAIRDILCPDHYSVCPDNYTCCQQPSGHYGCCPLINAACCEDGIYCCPSGYTCDTSRGCTQGTVAATLTELVAKDVARSVICPDGATACPDGNTCCSLVGGKYGCCPKGYTCDAKKGSCIKSSLGIMNRIPFSAKPPFRRL